MATGTRGATKTVKVAGRRPDTDAPAGDGHRDRMLAYILKAETPASRQIEDPFAVMYGEGLALEPPLDPERLLLLADESAPHGACLDAKADDTVGRGWTLEPTKTAGADPANPAEAPDEGDDSAATPSGTADTTIAGDDADEAVTALEETLEGLTPDYTFAELLWAAAWESDAIGWASWEMVNASNGKLGAIYPLPAHTLRATKDKDVFVQSLGGQVRYFARFGSGKRIDGQTGRGIDGEDQAQRRTRDDPSVDNLATEVLVFRGYSARSQRYPLPRWVSAIPAIAELTAIREFNVSFFASGGVVDRIIHVTAGDGTAAQTLADDIQEQINEAAGQAHVTLVTGGDPQSDVKVQFLTPTQGRREGQFVTRRQELLDEVLMAHKVPGYRVARAIVGALTGAGPSREMLHTYRLGTIEPKQGMLEHRLNATLFGPVGLKLQGFRWRLEDLDWDETELDLKIAQGIVDYAIGSPDEGREVMGLSATGEDAMTRHYFHGVELGSPKAGPSTGAVATLDDLRAAARDRLAARPAVAPEPAASTNGHSTEDVPATSIA